MLLTTVPITNSLRNIFKGSTKLVPKGHSLFFRIAPRESQIFWKSDEGTCVGTVISCDGFDSTTLCKVLEPKTVWTQLRKSKVKEVTITKGCIQVGRKKYKLQTLRGGDRLYDFGKLVKDLDVEYNSSTGMVGFRTLRDPGIHIVVKLKSNTVSELNKVKKLFYGKQINIKRKHIIMSETDKGAGRTRGPAPAAPGAVAPPPISPAAPAAPPVAAAPPSAAPAPPTNTEAPPVAPAPAAPPVATTPAPPVAPPVKTPAKAAPAKVAPAKAPTPATAPEAPATEPAAEGTDVTEEEVETTEEKDWCDFVRTKAPLKGERNSADKLVEKGWLCLPHAHHDLAVNDIRQAVSDLDNLKAAYLESLYIIASKGTVSDEEKAAIGQAAVAEFKKKLANL